ncbi:hypothetical protein [Desulfotruncus alcoholivorax]|uniref:hypothetical protein n=1 Tax=Desulfotruncus alcoholivorax TaxID=265477 RepID=UPI0004229197|nr:hypothetical protein [Desulfotruncus alcoholivorax]
MIAIVKYIAKREKDHLETISREIISITPGDLDEEYSDLARIIFPSIMKMIEEQETVINAASR